MNPSLSRERLAPHERETVQRNLFLVGLTLRRFRHRFRTPDEHQELLQEGCLALIEAVRSHDAARHGGFAAYAMARIRYAISVHVHEQHGLIRVPFITQRRRKKKLNEQPMDPHTPNEPHHLVRVPLHPQHAFNAAPPDGVTIADLVRERYDRALGRVVRDMLASRRCATHTRDVVRCCRDERWTVPEAEERTPIRQIAVRLGCSTGRITHCEARFRGKLAKILRRDTVYRWLRRLARRRSHGWRHTLTEGELRSLRRGRKRRRPATGRVPRRLTPTRRSPRSTHPRHSPP